VKLHDDGWGAPAQDIGIVFVPLVWSLNTMSVPATLWVVAAVNDTTTCCEAPAAIVPEPQLHVRVPVRAVPAGTPAGLNESAVTVSVELPLLVIVNVAVLVAPIWTFPKARLPLNPTTRVEVGDGCVDVVLLLVLLLVPLLLPLQAGNRTPSSTNKTRAARALACLPIGVVFLLGKTDSVADARRRGCY
jgi:hypothetical protein